MLDTTIKLSRIDDPFPFFSGGPLLSRSHLQQLNAELPERSLYSREIKTGAEHRKRYNMWRCGVFENGAKTPAALRLPAAWSKLLDSLIAHSFRAWLTGDTGVDLENLPVTIGLYIFENGDFTTIDTGKVEKALSVALYLNDQWAAEDGGNLHLWRSNDPYTPPACTFVPRGGHVVVGWWGESTWHNIAAVRNGRSRQSMMIEYWKA